MVSSCKAPGETPDPSASTQPTVAPTSEPNDLLHGKYSEKFTSGEVVRDENGYRSGNVCVEMSKHTMTVQGQPVCYYVADIYIKDITSLRSFGRLLCFQAERTCDSKRTGLPRGAEQKSGCLRCLFRRHNGNLFCRFGGFRFDLC